MNRQSISDKLRKITTDIELHGYANLTRLTVLKKWLELSNHLTKFAIFIACQASKERTQSTKQAADLLHEAHNLLADVDVTTPRIPRATAAKLRARLKEFQNDYRGSKWGKLRIIHNNNLFLVESGLDIYLGYAATPSEGYRLAVNYCANYDQRYGECLNGPSLKRIGDIVDFISLIENRDKEND